MPTIIAKCPQCQTPLNVPEEAVGRRLKCPRPECGHKFQLGGGAGPTSSESMAARPESTYQGQKAGPPPAAPAPRPTRAHDDFDLPVASTDLRETFDLPLMTEEDRPSRPSAPPAQADALELLKDDGPIRRRPTGAAARAQARRCSCGGVVPAGMSLCGRCGLDLDTGRRESVEEMLDDAPPPIASNQGPPLIILTIGALALLASALLTVVSFMSYANGTAGAQLLGVVCLFGVFASIQFLRGKSSRPLLVALALGAAVDTITLIALPAWEASAKVEVAEPIVPVLGGEDSEVEDKIPSYSERLEQTGGTQKITWGVVILLVDGFAFVYLCTAGVSRHFDRPRFLPG